MEFIHQNIDQALEKDQAYIEKLCNTFSFTVLARDKNGQGLFRSLTLDTALPCKVDGQEHLLKTLLELRYDLHHGDKHTIAKVTYIDSVTYLDQHRLLKHHQAVFSDRYFDEHTRNIFQHFDEVVNAYLQDVGAIT